MTLRQYTCSSNRWPCPLGVLLAVALCFGVSPLRAQTITGTLELSRKEPRPLFFEYCAADEGLVTISTGGKSSRSVSLFKYDAVLAREWSVPLFDDRESRLVSQLEVLQDHILVFYEEEMPRSSAVELKLLEFDLAGKTSGPARVLYAGERDKKANRLMRYESAIDNRRLMLYGLAQGKDAQYVVAPTDSAAPVPGEAYYAYTVFDAKTDSIYQGQVALWRFGLEGELMQARIGVSGKLFFLMRYTAERGRSLPSYVIYRYDYHSHVVEELTLDFGGKRVVDLTMKADIHDNVLVGGFWSLADDGGAAGVLYARVPHDGSAPVLKSDRFGAELLARFASKRKVEKGRAELDNFVLDNLVLRVDEGLIMTAEQYYVTTTTYRDAYGFWDTRRIYHFDDVLVVSISPSGTIEWNSIVAKQQAAERPQDLSYALMVGPEELIFFYKARFRGAVDNVVFTKVGYDGSITGPKSFYASFRGDDIFYRSSAQQVSNTDGLLVHYQNGPRLFTLTRLAF